MQNGALSGSERPVKKSLFQGLVNVPFWEYWTSPYCSHKKDHIPNGWVMFNGDMTNDPCLSPCFGKGPFVSRQRLGLAQTPHRSWVRRALWAPRSFHLCDKCSYDATSFSLSTLRVSGEDPLQQVVLEASRSIPVIQNSSTRSS